MHAYLQYMHTNAINLIDYGNEIIIHKMQFCIIKLIS